MSVCPTRIYLFDPLKLKMCACQSPTTYFPVYPTAMCLRWSLRDADAMQTRYTSLVFCFANVGFMQNGSHRLVRTPNGAMLAVHLSQNTRVCGRLGCPDALQNKLSSLEAWRGLGGTCPHTLHVNVE